MTDEATSGLDLSGALDDLLGGQPAGASRQAADPAPDPDATPDDDDDNDVQAQAKDGQDPDEGDGEKESAAEQLMDYVFGDRTLKVPAELQPILDGHKDFEQRTAALRAREAELDQEREGLSAWRESEEEHRLNLGLRDVVSLQLEQYRQAINNPQLTPQQRQEAMQHIWQLENAKQDLDQKIAAGDKKHSEAAEQRRGQRIKAAFDAVSREIPGFAEKRWPGIVKMLGQVGIPEGAAKAIFNNADPSILKTLNYALDGFLTERALAKARQGKQPGKSADVLPLKRVGQRASSDSAGSLSDRLPASEWIARRNKQVAKARNSG